MYIAEIVFMSYWHWGSHIGMRILENATLSKCHSLSVSSGHMAEACSFVYSEMRIFVHAT